MLKEYIFIKKKGIEIPIEIKRFEKSRGLKLLGKGNNIRVTTTSFISKTKIKEILKPYSDKIYLLYLEGLKGDLEDQSKKDNLQLHAYVEGVAVEIVFEVNRGNQIASDYRDDSKQIVIRMNEEPNYEIVYQELDKLYLVLAKLFLPMYFEYLLGSFGYKVKPELRIKKMAKQWGNCKKAAPIITLNSQLVKLPPKLINYIIFHELAHLVEANHSKDFYKIIEHRHPNRKELDQELKLWGFVLNDNYVEEYQGEKSH